MRVWVGSIKLEQKLPTPDSLDQLLYGNPSNSAHDADVVALYLNDLVVTEENIEGLQNLLSKAIRDKQNYVYNEEDSGLVLQNIPAQLTHISEEHQRFVSLSVAVHRRNVQAPLPSRNCHSPSGTAALRDGPSTHPTLRDPRPPPPGVMKPGGRGGKSMCV